MTLPPNQVPSRCLFVLIRAKPSQQSDPSSTDINTLYKTIPSIPISLPLSHKPLTQSKLHIYTADGTTINPTTGLRKKKSLYVLTHENLNKDASDFTVNDSIGIPEDQRFQFCSKGQCVESTFSDMHMDVDGGEDSDLLRVENHYLLRLAKQLGFSLKKTFSFHFYHAKQESFDIRLARVSATKYMLDVRYLPTGFGLTDTFWKEVVERIVVEGWNVQGPNIAELQNPMLILQYVALMAK